MVRKNANAGAGDSGARQGFPKQNRPADNSHSSCARQASAQSWRDVLPIHPAAELFPRMSADELRTLGEDIKKNGLTSPIVLWEAGKTTQLFLLDGRGRLDAMEAVGLPVVGKDGEWLDLNFALRCAGRIRGGDPYAYVVSANVHRRHLSAEQKRDLIGKLI